MGDKIRIGINGYGNLGKGAVKALRQNPDMELAAVFTRRDPSKVGSASDIAGKAEHVSNMGKYSGKIDVMLLCGGSALDLGVQGPEAAALFNTVDSFDTHAKIPAYFDKMDMTGKASGKLSIISVGWDPGLFSLNRLLSSAILPLGRSYTFWGKGVSQGHSDALRRVPGVENAIQYTVPVDEALRRVRSGENPVLSTREKHTRVCYVVPEEGADLVGIERSIKNMPDYFSDYDTFVHFINREELKKNHSKMPHGGFVIHAGTTADSAVDAVAVNGNLMKHKIEFSLILDSNPEFTGSVLVAYARAAYRLAAEGRTGAHTVFDIPFCYLSSKTASELRKELL
ncbi:MAG: diaminopimelate dehydrogenase [Eubacteriales bacterium]|nr:diaminopimelate dehydrogenase [Eubacteriales bacterium]